MQYGNVGKNMMLQKKPCVNGQTMCKLMYTSDGKYSFRISSILIYALTLIKFFGSCRFLFLSCVTVLVKYNLFKVWQIFDFMFNENFHFWEKIVCGMCVCVGVIERMSWNWYSPGWIKLRPSTNKI